MKRLLVLLGRLALLSSAGPLTAQDWQALVDQTPAGQTLTLPSGVYRGSLVIRKPLDLRALPGAKLVRSDGATGPTLWIRSANVTVQGLEIEGTGEGKRVDRTAILVTGSNVALSRLTVRNAWSGLWLDGATQVTLSDLEITGLKALRFWERGEAILITKASDIVVERVRIRAAADGIYAEGARRVQVSDCRVDDARYAFHSMFSSQGKVSALESAQTVVGVMLMESSWWSVSGSRLTNGYRTGSAGVRQIRTSEVSIEDNEILRQAAGVELIDVRNGRFVGNLIGENATAWTWGRDNTGTVAQGNVHRGNLLDFAAQEPSERDWMDATSHMDGQASQKSVTAESGIRRSPQFDRNYWDGWRGTDLNQDGIGDTPYVFDFGAAARAATQPWAGVFVGSPWSQWSRGLPGGTVIDEHPLRLAHR